MSSIILTGQSSAPSAPSTGKGRVYIDNTGSPILKMVDDQGAVSKILDTKLVLTNTSTAQVTGGYAADTYLVGSSITIPAGRLVAQGFVYHCRFDMTKTAAGVAAGTVNVRFGTAGTTSDTSRILFTLGAGTAVADTGIFEIWVVFRSVGSGTSAVMSGVLNLSHNLAATGLTSVTTGGNTVISVVSSGFDSTVASSIIGLSFNGGASFSGTNNLVQTEAYNLNL